MKRKMLLIPVSLVLLLTGFIGSVIAQEEEKDDPALREKITALSQSALVKIHFEFQKDPAEGLPEDYGIRHYINNKTTWDTSGILVQPEGTVLMNDSMLKRKYIKKITVIDSAGNEYEAELAAFLKKYPAAFLKIKGDKKPAGSVNFVDAGELNISRKFYLASLFKDNENWFIKAVPLGLSINTPYGTTPPRLGRDYAVAPQSKPWFHIFARESEDIAAALISFASRFEGRGASLTKAGSVILFDEKAQPIGIPLEGRIELNGDRYGWSGSELLKSPAVDYTELDKKIEEIKKQSAGQILEVKFLFRQPEKEKGGDGPYARGRTRRSYPGGDEEEDDERGFDITEKKLYGLVIDQSRIFIPRDLPDELIHRIENIEVLLNETKYPAQFLGIYKDFTGMLIELADKKAVTKSPDIYKINQPELGRAWLTIHLKEKFNKRYEDVHYDRFTGIAKGYKNDLQYRPGISSKVGTFFIGFEGEPVGVLLSRKRELEDRLSEGSSYSFYYGSGSGDIKPYFFSELKKYFTDPAEYFDKKLRPLSDREMKRIIWLGVGFQPLTKDLAEQLGCQKITREGKLGLLVNHIHDDSPAAKAGLKTGDVLLKIREEGKDTPIDLMSQSGYDPYSEVYARFGEMEDFSYFAESGLRPWPNVGNYLNQILTQIGEDKKITLTYWRAAVGEPHPEGRENKELTQNFVLEKSPYDFESTEKYKDETTGLTIRELTYEVRHAWRLAGDYQAIIIGKVEEGSKAAIGGITVYELITKIEDQPVASIADYKKVMESLTADKTKEKAKFTVERMGKSRLVDVELKN
ncbi:MAG: hypothetical protein AAB019_09890 [Planctomycetota bacterium]